MPFRPMDSNVNSHFRSQTTGAACGSARCSWLTSNAESEPSARVAGLEFAA